MRGGRRADGETAESEAGSQGVGGGYRGGLEEPQQIWAGVDGEGGGVVLSPELCTELQRGLAVQP